MKRGWVANGLNFEWELKSGSPIFQNPDIAILSKNWFMVGTKAIAIPKPGHLKTKPF